MDRLGLGYDDLSAINPRIVFASITGYGLDGPLSGRRAYAPVVAAEVGFLELSARYRNTDVEQDPYSHGDLYAGLQCLSGILSALFQRERTGRGQQVEVSLADALLSMNEYASTVFSGFPPEARGQPAALASPILTTKEGHKVTIGGDPLLRDNFACWCRAMGREDLKEDPRFVDHSSRKAHRDELIAIFAEWVAGFDDLDELGRRLEAGGHAYGIVRTLAEIGESEWARSRGVIAEVSDRGDGVFRLPNAPWRFSDAEAGVRGVPAYRGEHNREVFQELLGLSDSELDDLEARGVLSSRGARLPER
jgi:crotonobetainyl-CoA:carnitine CoA-transferase CaiB-like acyl-CoA transferase